METNITSRRAYLNKIFKERVNKKLEHLDGIFKDNAVANIVAIEEKGRETIELTIKSGSMILRAQKTTSNFIESFDLALGAIMRQLLKNKTKLEKRFKSRAYEKNYAELLPRDENEEQTTAEYNVVKNKKFIVKPMDVQEAILQMNLIEHEFYVFIDDETNELNVVYKRRNGGYGLIKATQILD
ncbi:ribosomal subunit interface protein [Clostridia bacterium]|nr:ribosomal subunit interface protein [Clostridia bacterium]